MEEVVVRSYEEAAEIILKAGILPFSGFIPDHHSLESICSGGAWHTGTEDDPWLWRVRLAGDGIAAYGRFLGGKPMFVGKDLFPLFRAALQSVYSVDERGARGLVSEPAVRVYNIITDHNGIEVSELRKRANMQEKKAKAAFDRGLIQLQNTAAIVISGSEQRVNAMGQPVGWKGTCYMTSERWMEQKGMVPALVAREQALDSLIEQLKDTWSELALKYLRNRIEKNWD
jgi:hypothetical protein